MLARRAAVAIPAALVVLGLIEPVREAEAQPSGANGGGVKACTSLAEDGQRLRAAGKLIEAREKLMACSATECPQVVRVDCAQWASEVLAATPTIVLDVKDESGNDVAIAKVFIDDREVSDRIDGRPITVNPGARNIRVERSDGKNGAQSIVAKENAKGREVKITFGVAAVPSRGETSSGAWGWQQYAGIAMIAVGAIAITYATVSFWSYKNDESTLRDKFDAASEATRNCPSFPTDGGSVCAKNVATREQLRAEYNENEEQASKEAPFVLTAGVGGGLLVVGGIALFVFAPKSSPVGARPIITPMFSGMTFGGSF